MGDKTDLREYDPQALADFVATLLPVQQQAIATAQLAGCRFERRTYERFLGFVSKAEWREQGAKRQQWAKTTEYALFMPDGTLVGVYEDIYECAVIALRRLDGPPSHPTDKMFKLDPWNEP